MNSSDIVLLRLYNQSICRSRFKKPEEVVSWLGALQAQDFSGAKWSVGLRLKNATETDILNAIEERKIVRTWPMRGTLHFVASEDVRWMSALLNPRVIANASGRYKQLGLSEVDYKKSGEVFAGALRGGKRLTRDEMRTVLEESGVSTANQRGYHLLGRHAQEGLICFGPPRDRQQTFVLVDEWIPKTKEIGKDEALARLALRYFTGHGPATLKDFVWWSGLRVSDARAGLEMAGAQLISETVDGQIFWMSRSLPMIRKKEAGIQLLPGFDEYILGYTDRRQIINPVHYKKIYSGLNLIFNPTILVNGRVTGTWKRRIGKNKIHLSLRPFKPFTKKEKMALSEAARRYGKFMGTEISY